MSATTAETASATPVPSTTAIVALSDGSDFSWRGVHVAHSLARTAGLALRIIEVALLPGDADMIRESLQRRVDTELDGVDITMDVLVQDSSIAATVANHVTAIAPGTTVVMSSVGRGRSASVLGSVAEDILRELHGPLMVVGPSVRNLEIGASTGQRILVTLDGSTESASAIAVAASWGIEHQMVPWLITVVEGDRDHPDGAADTYLARTAADARRLTHRDVEFEVLHGRHTAQAIADYADADDVGMIVATTHGRGGLSRLALGSTAMSLVHTSPVPVIVVRPPHLR